MKRTRGGAAIAVALAVTAACAPTAAALSKSKLASKLAKLDPGARVGGNTHVATADGARLHGGPRSDFVFALGDRQAVVGRGGADQLGALGKRATIRAGKGSDHLYGGPAATLAGGRGPDLLSSTSRRVKFRVAGADLVYASGPGAWVRCAASVERAVIHVRRGTRVEPACSRNGAAIRRSGGEPSGELEEGPHAAQVSGDGSNDHPYVAPCDDPADDPCTVSSFAARGLTGLWAHEYVPAYECPTDQPWLINTKYAPAMTAIPNGIEIEEQLPWAIGINISGQSWFKDLSAGPPNRFSGTLTGFPSSSATSWSFGTHFYRVILHCTRTCDRGYDLTGSHPCVSSEIAAAPSRSRQ